MWENRDICGKFWPQKWLILIFVRNTNNYGAIFLASLHVIQQQPPNNIRSRTLNCYANPSISLYYIQLFVH